MQATQHTISYLSEQPGWCRSVGMCPSVYLRQIETRLPMNAGVQYLSITNEQNKSYASELGMT